MSAAPPARIARTAAARTRIVAAAIRCLVHDGLAGASMSAIAAAAQVSKALLHYHFADRASLLTAVLAELTARTIAREQGAQGVLERVPGHRAVDAVWTWFADELARGELRALLELTMSHEPALRVAADAARARRRRTATRTVELVFGKLGLTPRISPALLGNAALAFADGLVMGRVADERDARAGFDVFWLALLGLVA